MSQTLVDCLTRFTTNSLSYDKSMYNSNMQKMQCISQTNFKTCNMRILNGYKQSWKASFKVFKLILIGLISKGCTTKYKNYVLCCQSGKPQLCQKTLNIQHINWGWYRSFSFKVLLTKQTNKMWWLFQWYVPKHTLKSGRDITSVITDLKHAKPQNHSKVVYTKLYVTAPT